MVKSQEPSALAGGEDDPGVSGPRAARPRYEEEEDLRRGPALEEAVPAREFRIFRAEAAAQWSRATAAA